MNRLLSPGPGPTPPGLAGADVRPLPVRGSCSIDVWSSDRVPKPCATRRTLATLARRSRGGVHHSGQCRKGATRRNPPWPTDSQQPIQHAHTHQSASCASRQRPTWPATCASINVFATVGGDESPSHRHASPCPIRWCGRPQLCAAPPAFPTWRHRQRGTRVTRASTFGPEN